MQRKSDDGMFEEAVKEMRKMVEDAKRAYRVLKEKRDEGGDRSREEVNDG